MKTIVIPAGMRIVAAEQRSPYDKQPTLPKKRPLLITRRGICGDPLGADCDCPVCMPFAWPAHDAPDAYDYVLEHELPAFLRPQAGEPRTWNELADQLNEHTRTIAARMQPLSRIAREVNDEINRTYEMWYPLPCVDFDVGVDELDDECIALNLCNMFGLIDFNVGQPHLCLPKP